MGAKGLVAFLVKLYMAAWDGDSCMAYDASWTDMNQLGVCVWDDELEDGECGAEGSAVLQTLFKACHGIDTPVVVGDCSIDDCPENARSK